MAHRSQSGGFVSDFGRGFREIPQRHLFFLRGLRERSHLYVNAYLQKRNLGLEQVYWIACGAKRLEEPFRQHSGAQCPIAQLNIFSSRIG